MPNILCISHMYVWYVMCVDVHMCMWEGRHVFLEKIETDLKICEH